MKKSKKLLTVFSICSLTLLVILLFTRTASAGTSSDGLVDNAVDVAPQSASANITITKVAPLGETGKVSGVVGAGIKNYKVAVLISVYGSWWTKPYFNKPLTSIGSGKWSTTFTTGGIDIDAEEVRAYLIPKGINPPHADGGDIPSFYDSYEYDSVIREYPDILGIKTKRSVSLKTGKHVYMPATPYAAHNVKVDAPITWVSADPSVATTDDFGTITAISPGTTEITVDLDSGVFGYSTPAVIKVTVK